MYNMTNLQPMGCMQPCTASPAATLCTTPSWQWLCLAKRLGSAPGTHNNQTWVCDWHCLGWSHDTGRAQCSADSSDSKLFCCPEHARLSPFHSSPLGIRVDEISPSHTAGSGGKGWERTAYTTLEIQQFLMIAPQWLRTPLSLPSWFILASISQKGPWAPAPNCHVSVPMLHSESYSYGHLPLQALYIQGPYV